MAKHGGYVKAQAGNPGAHGPISGQGGRGGRSTGGTPKGRNTAASWPRPAGAGQVAAQRGNPGARGPISGHGGGRGGSRKPTRGTGAPGAAGIGSTN